LSKTFHHRLLTFSLIILPVINASTNFTLTCQSIISEIIEPIFIKASKVFNYFTFYNVLTVFGIAYLILVLIGIIVAINNVVERRKNCKIIPEEIISTRLWCKFCFCNQCVMETTSSKKLVINLVSEGWDLVRLITKLLVVNKRIKMFS